MSTVLGNLIRTAAIALTSSAACIPLRQAAKALIRWLASPAAYAAIKKSGLQPAESNYK